MLLWINFTLVWTLSYAAIYAVFRPEILFRKRPSHAPWWTEFSLPRWTDESTDHAAQHYKGYIPVALGLWVVLFLMAVEVKDHLGQ
jgi:hypothetical protein